MQDAVSCHKFSEFPPPLVMMQMKRYQFNPWTNAFVKTKRGIDIPTELNIRDLATFVEEPMESLIYELQGVVMHQGNIAAGHYFSYVKRKIQMNGEERVFWFEFNDEDVYIRDESFVLEAARGGLRTNITLDKDKVASRGLEWEAQAYVLLYADWEAAEKATDPRTGIPSHV